MSSRADPNRRHGEPGRPSTLMAEVGIDIRTEFPKPWIDEIIRAADVVITMGCGDACPVYPGKRYEDWVLDDPAGLVSKRSVRSATRFVAASRS